MPSAPVTSAALEEWYEALESWNRAWTSLLPGWPWIALIEPRAAERWTSLPRPCASTCPARSRSCRSATARA